jgi:DNA-binding PadR family transcriptional regulator
MLDQGLIVEIDTTNDRRRDKRTNKRYEIAQKGENVLRYFKDTKAFGIEDIEIAW